MMIGSFVATLFLTAIMRLAQNFGITRMDIPLMLGTMMTPDRDRAKVSGFLAHMLNGWVFGLLYGAGFRAWRHSSVFLGAAIGFVHGAFILITILPILPGAHRRMASDFLGPQPTTSLEPPGFLALNYGRMTPIVTMVAHVIYGGIIGFFYRLPGEKD